ncbi:MAG TPA: hypothetical protein PKA64_24795 [Myxococcota bacterium]|nr:hypothetical protein [Myxococcota bacterium]
MNLRAAALLGLTLAAPSAFADELTTTTITGSIVSVVVDGDACASPYSFCSDTGSTGAPGAGNGNAVALIIQVIGPNLTPVTGLGAGAFRIVHILSPTGAGVVAPGCASCFSDRGNGVYRYVVQPNGGAWQTGTYVGQLQVTAGGRTINTLLPIDVP